MKIINHDIDSIEVTSANANWPITNVLDNFALNYWKAVDNQQTATIELHMPNFSPYCNAVYIGYTSANIATLEIWNSAESAKLLSDISMYLIPFNFFSFLHQKQVIQSRESFQDFTNPSEQSVLKLLLETTEITDLEITSGGTGYSAGNLTATGGNGSGFRGTYTVNSSGVIDSVTIINPGIGYTSFSSSTPTIVISDSGGTGAVITPKSTLNAGIIRSGYAKEFSNPNYGFSESKKNSGIQINYIDGSIQSINGRIRREFRITLNIDILEEENLKERLDFGMRNPIAIDCFNGERRGVLIGWIIGGPSYSRNQLNRITCSFNIREI